MRKTILWVVLAALLLPLGLAADLKITDMPTVTTVNGADFLPLVQSSANKKATLNSILGMTSIGDLLYGGASGYRTRLAGNTGTTKKFLSQTGNGSVPNAPSWNTVNIADVVGADTAAQQSYTVYAENTLDTPTFSGTGFSAPTGTPTKLYQGYKLSNRVHVDYYFLYPSAGSGITKAVIDLPAALPTPAGWTGVTNKYSFGCTGSFTTSGTSSSTTRSTLIQNGSGDWQLVLEAAALNVQGGWGAATSPPFDGEIDGDTLAEIDFSSSTWRADADVSNQHYFNTPAPFNATEVDDPLGYFGGKVHQVWYPANSTNPGQTPRGGEGFQARLGLGSGRRALGLDYYVYFPLDFQFVKGGKLPGLYGGDTDGSSGCEPQGDDTFSTRLMWRPEGAGELYLYSPNRSYVSSPGPCGESVGRGNFYFIRGQWNHVRQYVELEDGNDRIRVWVNDMVSPGVDLAGHDIELPGHPLEITGFFMSTFFGGGDSSWASPVDQRVYFAGVRVWEVP